MIPEPSTMSTNHTSFLYDNSLLGIEIEIMNAHVLMPGDLSILTHETENQSQKPVIRGQ